MEQALADEDESIRDTAAEMLAELAAAKSRGQPSARKGAQYPYEQPVCSVAVGHGQGRGTLRALLED